MDTKTGTVPSLSFSAGFGTMLFYFAPMPEALDAALGIAALTAMITPAAMIGRAYIAKLIEQISGEDQ